MDSAVRRLVSFESERECRFALSWLSKIEKLSLPGKTGNNLETLNRQINEMLSSLPAAGTQGIRLEDKLQELEVAVKENILSDADMDWLSRNPVATLYLWWRLKVQKHAIFFRDPKLRWGDEDSFLRRLTREDEHKLFDMACTSQPERLKWVIDYLDSLIIVHSDHVYTKGELLGRLKNEFINERRIRLSPAWLVAKDEGACKWAWDYISDYQRKYSIKRNKDNPSTSVTGGSFTSNYRPDESDLGEYVLAVQAAFELWEWGDDARELFVNKMSRSWSQYSLRRSRKDKKPINCYVDSATKKKLESYCVKTNSTITEVIETLINNHCKPPY